MTGTDAEDYVFYYKVYQFHLALTNGEVGLNIIVPTKRSIIIYNLHKSVT